MSLVLWLLPYAQATTDVKQTFDRSSLKINISTNLMPPEQSPQKGELTPQTEEYFKKEEEDLLQHIQEIDPQLLMNDTFSKMSDAYQELGGKVRRCVHMTLNEKGRESIENIHKAIMQQEWEQKERKQIDHLLKNIERETRQVLDSIIMRSLLQQKDLLKWFVWCKGQIETTLYWLTFEEAYDKLIFLLDQFADKVDKQIKLNWKVSNKHTCHKDMLDPIKQLEQICKENTYSFKEKIGLIDLLQDISDHTQQVLNQYVTCNVVSREKIKQFDQCRQLAESNLGFFLLDCKHNILNHYVNKLCRECAIKNPSYSDIKKFCGEITQKIQEKKWMKEKKSSLKEIFKEMMGYVNQISDNKFLLRITTEDLKIGNWVRGCLYIAKENLQFLDLDGREKITMGKDQTNGLLSPKGVQTLPLLNTCSESGITSQYDTDLSDEEMNREIEKQLSEIVSPHLSELKVNEEGIPLGPMRRESQMYSNRGSLISPSYPSPFEVSPRSSLKKTKQKEPLYETMQQLHVPPMLVPEDSYDRLFKQNQERIDEVKARIELNGIYKKSTNHEEKRHSLKGERISLPENKEKKNKKTKTVKDLFEVIQKNQQEKEKYKETIDKYHFIVYERSDENEEGNDTAIEHSESDDAIFLEKTVNECYESLSKENKTSSSKRHSILNNEIECLDPPVVQVENREKTKQKQTVELFLGELKKEDHSSYQLEDKSPNTNEVVSYDGLSAQGENRKLKPQRTVKDLMVKIQKNQQKREKSKEVISQYNLLAPETKTGEVNHGEKDTPEGPSYWGKGAVQLTLLFLLLAVSLISKGLYTDTWLAV